MAKTYLQLVNEVLNHNEQDVLASGVSSAQGVQKLAADAVNMATESFLVRNKNWSFLEVTPAIVYCNPGEYKVALPSTVDPAAISGVWCLNEKSEKEIFFQAEEKFFYAYPYMSADLYDIAQDKLTSNPWFQSWTAGAPDSWTAHGSPTITRNLTLADGNLANILTASTDQGVKQTFSVEDGQRYIACAELKVGAGTATLAILDGSGNIQDSVTTTSTAFVTLRLNVRSDETGTWTVRLLESTSGATVYLKTLFVVEAPENSAQVPLYYTIRNGSIYFGPECGIDADENGYKFRVNCQKIATRLSGDSDTTDLPERFEHGIVASAIAMVKASKGDAFGAQYWEAKARNFFADIASHDKERNRVKRIGFISSYGG